MEKWTMQTESGEVDLELVRRIKSKHSDSGVACQSLALMRWSDIQPDLSDNDESDFEVLRSIKRRFKEYSSNGLERSTDQPDLFLDSRTNGLLDSEKIFGIWPSGSIESSVHESLENSCFQKSAEVFINGINKNRSYQKFLRKKLTEIEARIEKNKTLRDTIKILRDFQISCKRKWGRALSQRKEPKVQLISAKVDHKKAPARYFGPEENSQVGVYRMVLKNFPRSSSLDWKKWSKVEMEDLGKGIRQEFQNKLIEKSGGLSCGADGSCGDPEVHWEKLAYFYVKGRSGAECQARWLNYEDSLINHNKWTNAEDKSLLLIVQQKGVNNWIDIAVSLGTNRTPFQCLARHEKILNASFIKSEWTEDEDNQLRIAVETFGTGNWQLIASTLDRRTGNQCSNRYLKSLDRKRVGRFSPEEDKRLKVAVMLFGPKSWNKVCNFVPGRTQAQCRDRWVSSLDPSRRWGTFTEEEDSWLIAAIAEHGRHSWSKVAACVPPRTDNQCRRRWMVLFPHEVPLLQAAKKIQKESLISNFVDRESERPALGSADFLPLPSMGSISEPENVNLEQKKKSQRRPKSMNVKDSASMNIPEKIRSKRTRKNSDETDTLGEKDANLKNKLFKRSSKQKQCTERKQDGLLMIINGEAVPEFEGHDTKKKKKSRKCSEPSESFCIHVSERSLESETTDGDGAADRNYTTSINKKRAPRFHDTITMKKKPPDPHSNRSGCTEPTTSQSLVPTKNMSAEESGVHHNSMFSCGDSTLLMITNGKEVCSDDMNDDNLKKGAPTNSCQKRKRCTEQAKDNHGLSPVPESLDVVITEGNEIFNFPNGNTTSRDERANKKCCRRRKKSIEPSKGCTDFLLAVCQEVQPSQTITTSTNKKEIPKCHDTTLKKKKSPDPQSNRSKCTEPTTSQSLVSMKNMSAEESGVHQNSTFSCGDSTSLLITNGEVVCIVNKNECNLKKWVPTKPRQKRKRCAGRAKENHSILPAPESSDVVITEGNETLDFSNDNTTSKDERANKKCCEEVSSKPWSY